MDKTWYSKLALYPFDRRLWQKDGKSKYSWAKGQVQGQLTQLSESLSQSQKRLADIAERVVQHTPRMREPFSGPRNTKAHTGPRCVFFCTNGLSFTFRRLALTLISSLFSIFKTGSYYVAQASLKVVILLPQSSKYKN